MNKVGYWRFADLIAQEEGTVLKDWGGLISIAIVYPNCYYIGMSNLAVHLLYSFLNEYKDVVAERVFIEPGKPIRSIESGRHLREFDALFFSISFELDYFNIPLTLREADIPLYTIQRNDNYPVIVGSGAPLITNPTPIASFFDAIAIGEVEPLVPQIVEVLRSRMGRFSTLEEVSRIKGVLVPLLHTNEIITRQWAANLDEIPVSTTIFTSGTEFGRMLLMEVERGCFFNCGFCLVGNAFNPIRFRSLDSLLDQAKDGRKFRKKIGLVGPVISTHPNIRELLEQLRLMDYDISVSSLRIKSLSEEVIKGLSGGGVKTATIAPEAGSIKLRQLVGKDLSDGDILNSVLKISIAGIPNIKLYFMIGLPNETEEDVDAMINLVKKVRKIHSEAGGKRLNLSLSPFIPKANTPLQWSAMADTVILNDRISRLRRELAPLGVRISAESPAWCQIQAVLARGGEELVEVINHGKQLTLAKWKSLAIEYDIDIKRYQKEWPIESKLPWSFIDLG
jgi:radical SAM superfamily enzyme YgiQ (UPF0313 family)